MPTYPTSSEDKSATTASLTPAIPVPTYGPGGSFSVLARTHIKASPAAALSAVRDTTTWSSWNSFCPGCTFSSSSAASTDASPPSEIPHKPAVLSAGRENWLDVGSEVTLDVHMNGDGLVPGAKKSREQGIEVTRLEEIDDEIEEHGEGAAGAVPARKGFRIVWKSTGFSTWQLRSERVMEFVETLEEVSGERAVGTEYVCWETFGGILGPVVKMTVGAQLVDRFGDYARDIREFVEKAGGTEGGGEGKGDGVVKGRGMAR